LQPQRLGLVMSFGEETTQKSEVHTTFGKSGLIAPGIN
jgi:hypothetical protein